MIETATTAMAPAAPEIIAGRPPMAPVTNPRKAVEMRPEAGSTPATKEKATLWVGGNGWNVDESNLRNLEDGDSEARGDFFPESSFVGFVEGDRVSAVANKGFSGEGGRLFIGFDCFAA
jgi:hypothetical protein